MANRLDYAYRRLVNVLGPGRVKRGPFESLLYGHDFAALPKALALTFDVEPDFVVLPRTTEEVVRVVRFQAESGLPIVPRGGGTGMYGGAVPNRGGILIDFRMMNRVVNVDAANRTITVEAGCTWQEAFDRAWAAGLFLPVYPTFAISSTVGGWINSGGVGVGAMKYGSPRDLLRNLEVVLEDGTVLQTGSDRVDLGGSPTDLGPLFVGSEGTLALATRATLRLHPRPEEIRPLAYAFPTLAAALPALRALAASPVRPYHVALLDPSHLELVKAVHRDAPEPAAIALVVFEGPKDENAEGEKVVDALVATGGGAKLAAETAKDLWDDRRFAYPMRRISGGLVVCEAIVPLGKLGEALAQVRALRDRLKMEVGVHAAAVDANSVAVYPYFLDDEASPMPPARLAFAVAFRERMLDLGGHPMGIGLLLAFQVAAIHGNAHRFFRPIKETLDPQGRFNAGKMHEIRTKYDFPGLRRVPLSLAAFPIRVLGALKRIGPRDNLARRYTQHGGAR